MQKLKLLDLFAGIGGFSYAAHRLKIAETVGFVEKDKFCQKVLRKNFPDVPIYEDVTTFEGTEGEYDLITFGFPCFMPNTMIFTKQGYKPIQDVKIGDLVLTHKNRWRPVTNTMVNKKQELRTIIARDCPIFTTDDHPFYTHCSSNFAILEFQPAKSLTTQDYLVLPSVPFECHPSAVSPNVSQEFFFTLGKHIDLSSPSFPHHLFHLPLSHQESFLQGVLSQQKGESIIVKNKIMALSLAYICQQVWGATPSLAPNTSSIDNLYCQWTITPNSQASSFHSFNYAQIQHNSGTIRHFPTPFYNISVADDNSYVADGFVVHNCQDLSLAGKQRGFEGDRSVLFYDATRIIKNSKPAAFIAENVPGIKKFFLPVLEEFNTLRDYEIWWFTIATGDLGGAHKRNRWFAIGVRNDLQSITNSYQNSEGQDRNSERTSGNELPPIQKTEQGGDSQTIFDQRCHPLSSVNQGKLPTTSDSSSFGQRDSLGNADHRTEQLWRLVTDRPQNGGEIRCETEQCSLPITPHSQSDRLQKDDRPLGLQQELFPTGSDRGYVGSEQTETFTDLCGEDDGLSRRLHEVLNNMDELLGELMTPAQAYEMIYSHTATDNDLIESRSNRIKALGNAVTPQQAMIPLYYVFRLLLERTHSH